MKVDNDLAAILAGLSPQQAWDAFYMLHSQVADQVYPEVVTTYPATKDDWAAAVTAGLTTLRSDAWLDERPNPDPLTCPYQGCDGHEFFVMDACIRENRLQDPEFTDNHLYLSVEDVDSNFETFGYECQTCRRPVAMPTDGVLEIVWG